MGTDGTQQPAALCPINVNVECVQQMFVLTLTDWFTAETLSQLSVTRFLALVSLRRPS